MRKCYRCQAELNSLNKSIEHIIPNACGGRLKSDTLLCKGCNSFYGSAFDSELAAQTNDLVNLLRIRREKGDPLPIKATVPSSGVQYYLYHDDRIERVKPLINFQTSQNRHSLSISASNWKQIRQILAAYKKKYPKIDVDSAISSADDRKERINEIFQFNMSVGGEEVFRAITKIAINYFISIGGARVDIAHLMPYLDGVIKGNVVWLHYPSNRIYSQMDENEVSHVIKIRGDSSKRLLYAYVELFNAHNFILRLSDNYTGSDVDETYVYDLINECRVQRQFPLSYSKDDLCRFVEEKPFTEFNVVQESFERVLKIHERLKQRLRIRKAVDAAWERSIGKYPGETKNQDDALVEFGREVFILLQANNI